jgi:kynureninase
MFENNLTFAKQLDSQDMLSKYREHFHFPTNENGIEYLYFTGNSLGLMPKITEEYVQIELDDWKKHGVEAHFAGRNPWKDYHEFVTNSLARLVGAKPLEVVAMNTLTSNLNSMLYSFYRPTKERYKIVFEATAFPSDIYSLSEIAKNYGFGKDALIPLKPRDNENTIRTEDILSVIEENNDSIALIMLGAVNYYTGQFFELEKLTAYAKKYGIVVGYDLAHTIGNIPLELNKWGVDFAVWCSYKYLNAGPGATAGIFVHEKHAYNFSIPRLAGWWGHDKVDRFLMKPEFKPMSGAEGWQNSNPAILPLACLRASLKYFDEIGIDKLREKSINLTAYLEYLLNEIKSDKIEIITPSDKDQRGAQLSIRVKNSDKSLFNSLNENGVITDWREPDVIRVAPVPTYNSYLDCYQFVEILKKLI